MEKELTDSSYAKKALVKRKKDSHKGENGRLLVAGGNEQFIGAPILSALAGIAALRSGTDLVNICAPEKVAWAINCFSPDLITTKFAGKNFSEKHAKKVIELSKKNDCLLIGPGLGLGKGTQKFAKKVVSGVKVPVVVDGDAIKALKGKIFKNNCVLTPHSNEFEVFSGKKVPKELNKRKALVKKVSLKHKCVILLTGKVDVISCGKKVKINKTGNAGMTVGGTGDVLAGLCAGLVAQGAGLLEAACSAAYFNGLAGNRAHKKYGYGLMASDLLEELPKLLFQPAKKQ